MLNIKRVCLGGLLLVVAVATYLHFTAPLRIELPYGETLILRDVQFGLANSSDEFSTMKLQFELKEPSYYPSQIRRSSLSDAVKFRVLHWGDDGFAYEANSGRSYVDDDTAYFTVSDQNYSRSSKMIHVQLQARESHDKPWEDLYGFKVKNPTQASAAIWPHADYPVSKTNAALVCRLGEIQAINLKERTKYAYPQPVLQFPFQLLMGGKFTTNWMLRELSIKDSLGGGAKFLSYRKFTNGWFYYHGFPSANPDAIWKIGATVYILPERTSSNVFTLNMPPGVIRSNQLVVAGKIVNYWMDVGLAERLMLNLQTSVTNAHLLLLQVDDEEGKNVSVSFVIDNIEASRIIEKGPNLSCFYLPHTLRRSPFSMTFAIVEDIEFEFTVKPRLVKEFTELPPIAE